jgi:alkanesulfonate monooxygenase SsuD/methylene tetrahydromethanopterin reductase-like flavin-dependent oxidoreductase (luciferase family)
MEVWPHGFALPGRVAELARAAEEWGFTGFLVADSQNLTPTSGSSSRSPPLRPRACGWARA